MKNILVMIDIFGTRFNFNINEKEIYKTPLGGFFTLISLGIVVFFTFFFGIDFYYKTNPSIYTNTMVPDRYDDPLLLTPENLVIAWRIEDNHGIRVDFDKIIYPIQHINYYKKNEINDLENVYSKEIPITKCNKSNAKMKEFTNFHKFDEWYCFDWSHRNNTFGGYWDGDYVTWFQLSLYLCDRGHNEIEAFIYSNRTNCTIMSDYTNIETQKGGLSLSIMYPEYYFNPKDLVNPLQISYKNYFNFFTPQLRKIDRFYFNKVTVFDDKGWIFEDIQNKTLLSMNRNLPDLNINNIKNGTLSRFYEVNFYMEKGYKTIKRSFLKIQDVGAKLGGIIKVILLIFGSFNSFFSSHKLNVSFFLHLFDFNKKDKNEYDLLQGY